MTTKDMTGDQPEAGDGKNAVTPDAEGTARSDTRGGKAGPRTRKATTPQKETEDKASGDSWSSRRVWPD